MDQTSCGMPVEPLGNCSELLVALLSQHGLVAIHEDGVVTIPEHPTFKLALNVFGGSNDTIQLDALLVIGPGKVIKESLLGIGDNQKNALMDAQIHFVHCVFHVWLAGLFNKTNPETIRHNWTISGVPRKVTIGAVAWRGSDVGEKDVRWQKAWHDAVKSMVLPEGTHWIDFYYGQRNNESFACQVLLDNEPCAHLQNVMHGFDWIKLPELYSVRQFMIVQGGFDCADALDMYSSSLQEEELVADFSKKVPLCLAERHVRLGTLAFGRRLLSSQHLTLAMDAIALRIDNSDTISFDLRDDWLFVEMERIARMYPGMMSKELFESIAHRSAEVHGFTQALEAGNDVADIKMLFPIIPFSKDAFEFVSKLPSARRINAEQAGTLKRALNVDVKPGFRFPKLF